MKKLKLLALFLLLTFTFLLTPSVYAQKRVEVNLAKQTIYAYDNNNLMLSSLISSGKFTPTPTGTFYPWIKLKSTRMTGGSKALGTYYDLPNVPYVVYFYQGYGLHGTYWHNNFGTPMSHGCINLPTSVAQTIYNWIDYSTPIWIHH